MNIANICACVSCGIALASVLASIYAVVQSRKTALTGTYFSEMASAYADFLRCVGNLVFRRGNPERDALAASLKRLLLFASDEIGDSAQVIYVETLKWASRDRSDALELDDNLNQLEVLMRKDLEHFRKHGRH